MCKVQTASCWTQVMDGQAMALPVDDAWCEQSQLIFTDLMKAIIEIAQCYRQSP